MREKSSLHHNMGPWRWMHFNMGWYRTEKMCFSCGSFPVFVSTFQLPIPLWNSPLECSQNRAGNGASGIWLSTALNIHTKDRFISHSGSLNECELLMDGFLGLPAARTLPLKHRFPPSPRHRKTANREILLAPQRQQKPGKGQNNK